MAALKYSRQRESIKHFLASTNSHPTADTVYMGVREEFPNISLGTVYRNLTFLVMSGEVLCKACFIRAIPSKVLLWDFTAY